VLNGKNLKNQAQASVRQLVQKLKKFETQNNIMCLVRHTAILSVIVSPQHFHEYAEHHQLNHMDLLPKKPNEKDMEIKMKER
jgi:hypothetical protein